MKLTRWLVALVAAAGCLAPLHAQAGGGQSPTPAVDLALELALLDEAKAALQASDYQTARAKTAEAVEALLARPEMDRHERWLALLDAAGYSAANAQDFGLANRAWTCVCDVRSRTLPPDHRDLQAARMNLAATLHYSGDLAGARALMEQAIEVYSRTLPADHLLLQTARMNLAETIALQGDIASAVELEEQVLEVFSRTLPADHPNLQLARQNLAASKSFLGDLAVARALMEQVLEVYSRTLPEDHPELQATRSNLAATVSAQGDVAGARALFEQVLEVRSRTLPEDHTDLLYARHNLATALSMLGDHAGARPLVEQVLEVRSRTLPEDHPDLQASRSSLASTLYSLRDFAGARSLVEQVLEVRSRTLPENHPDLLISRLEVAATLAALGELAGARALEEQVLEVYSRTLPDDHPDLQLARMNHAGTLARLIAAGPDALGEEGDEEELKQRCAELVVARSRALTRGAREALLSSSGREAQARCASLAQGLDSTLSFAEGFGAFEALPGLEREAFVLSETTRAAALGSAALMRRAAGSPRYAELRASLREQSDGLAALAQKGTTSAEFQTALARHDTTQRELVQLARELSGGSATGLELDPDALAARLAEGEALVALRRYTRWRFLGEREVFGPCLAAFVLRRNADETGRSSRVVTFVQLGDVAPIEAAVGAWRGAIGAGVERGTGLVTGVVDATRQRGRELRRLVFDPLLPALGDAERVVIALDDVLHLVPLDALPLEEEAGVQLPELIGERWRIETRCTLAELLAPAPAAAAGALVALGGPMFNSEPLALDADELEVLEEAARPTKVAAILRDGSWGRGFAPLTYTGLEAREIAALYEEVFAGESAPLVLEKRKASRAALEEVAPKARFLHVATHGWFAPESIRSWQDPQPLDRHTGLGLRLSGEEQVKGMSPMLLCGLALAGANLPENAVGRAPGLVTAEEIASWGLSNCELAVLSACDTSVGERRAGQGVASLQMALQMAGARSVITSLWKVPDEATRELMLDFYRRIWVEKKPKAQALWEAKMRLRDAKDAAGRPLYTTRDWAGWVLTGEGN
jgi:CHAT domain-containing protein/tetratricopeptide (TPR) repeat protein